MFTCNIPQLTLIQLKYDCDIENISGPWIYSMFMQSSASSPSRSKVHGKCCVMEGGKKKRSR